MPERDGGRGDWKHSDELTLILVGAATTVVIGHSTLLDPNLKQSETGAVRLPVRKPTYQLAWRSGQAGKRGFRARRRSILDAKAVQPACSADTCFNQDNT